MRRLAAPSATYGRQPILIIGDSNAAAGYCYASQYPAALQVAQVRANWAYHLYCHQGNAPASNAVSDKIVALGPFATDNPSLRGTWALDLGARLAELGMSPTILSYSIGGTTLDYYNSTVNGNSYATVLAWFQARLAELPLHRPPIVVCYSGTNGPGTDTSWAVGMGHVIGALRTDLGYLDMRLIVCRMPASWAESVGGTALTTVASQNTYVASDSNSRMTRFDSATFTDNATPPNEGLPCDESLIHIDSASGRGFALSVAKQIGTLL